MGIIDQYILIEKEYIGWLKLVLNQTMHAVYLMNKKIKNSVVFGTEILPAMMYFLKTQLIDYCNVSIPQKYKHIKDCIFATMILFAVFYNHYMESKKSKKQQIMHKMLNKYGFKSFDHFFTIIAKKVDACNFLFQYDIWNFDDTSAVDLYKLLLIFNLVKMFHFRLSDCIIEASRNVYFNKWRYVRCGNVSCNKLRISTPNGLKKCVNCKCVRYCSRKCQKIDWKNHKEICSILTSIKKKR